MRAIINFIQDLRKMSLIVQAWLMILGISNMMIPIVLFSVCPISRYQLK